MITPKIFLLIISCALVTWLLRITPFFIAKKFQMPEIIKKWLTYIPICILSALIFESLFKKKGMIVTINIPFVVAFLGTISVAVLTKSLAKTVLAGVIIMTIIRIFI